MFGLSDLYNSENGPTIAEVVIGIAVSVLFSAGLFLLVNAHTNNQAKQLQQTIEAIKKSQAEGISLSDALSELENANTLDAKKANTTPLKTPVSTPSSTVTLPNSFDSLTVTGDSNLEGSTKTGKDLAIAGKLAVTGSTAFAAAAQANNGLTVANGIGTDTLNTTSDVNIGGALNTAGTGEFGDALQADNGLTVTGGINTDTLTTSGTGEFGDLLTADNGLLVGGDITTDTLETNSDLTVGGNLNVNGSLNFSGSSTDNLTVNTDLNDGGTLEVAGAVTASGGLTVTGGTNTDTLTVNGATGTANASLTTDTLEATSDATVDGNLTVGGATAGSASLTTDTLEATGAADVGSLTVNGATGTASASLTTDTLEATGDTTIGGNLLIGGSTDSTALGVVGGITTDTLTANASASGSGDVVDVVGTSGFTGNLLDLEGSFAAVSVDYAGILHINSTEAYTNTCTGSDHLSITQVLDGIVTVGSCVAQNSGNDLAENYPSTQNLSAGDVVAIDPANSQYVVKSTVADDNLAIGVVSTAPGETLGSNEPGYPIALAGRVPVNVTNQGGAIAPGDYLTSSSTPGYAMKAASGDKTIGQALEAFSGTTGTVTAFVNVSPGNTSQQLQVTQNPPQAGAATFANLNVSGPTSLSDLQVTGTATINNLRVAGLTTVATITINGHIIGNGDTRGTLTVPHGTTTAHYAFAVPYDQVPTVVASPTNQAVLYSVNPTMTGFDINLPAPAAVDTTFDFMAQQ